MKLKLYSYWRSSCSYRVRIGLNLKGLEYEYKAVDLLKGEQFSPEFLKINPIGYVPALVDGDFVVSDSFAILMYLEEKYPQHPLLPSDLKRKAINYQKFVSDLETNEFPFVLHLQAANLVSSSIQPFQNLTGVKYIEEKVGADEGDVWTKTHIEKGFVALEKLLKDYAGEYATGDEVFLADLFLAPQLYAAINVINLDMTQFPLLLRLHEAYSKLPAFQNAVPEKQPDAPSS
ncbi:glutathione S-transferase Z1 [Citrus sinensis]|uniref:Glutathione S-transferase Z1 n=1 Tax=Citrus sinensis TaxID=2711 RepID=A0ACB8K6P4_CITSI|nr:glutathione S-transferase Z1 [Citrus sinensis]